MPKSKPVTLPGISKDVTKITLGLVEYENSEDEYEYSDKYKTILNYGSDLRGDLIISDYSQVTSIYIAGCALPRVASLKICDNPLLETIQIEGDDDIEEDYSFFRTQAVEICGFIFVVFSLDLPKLKSILLGAGEFFHAKSLVIKSLLLFGS